MLTDPVTNLNMSFTSQAISRKEEAFQLALCLRDEVEDHEVATFFVIRVDEPALCDGMSLKAAKKDAYLKHAVDAFRMSKAVAKKKTFIHTHLWYCDFADCMNSIDPLNADINCTKELVSILKPSAQLKQLGTCVISNLARSTFILRPFSIKKLFFRN